MHKILEWIKQKKNILKGIFIAAVILIVVLQLFSIGKHISGNEVKNLIASLPFINIVGCILIGLIAVSPMVLYDFILHKIIEKKEKGLYIFETSWLVNTMNNLIGFGGLFSFGLRSQFYSTEEDEKRVLHAISKVFLFTMSGLSLYSLGCLLLVVTNHANDFLDQYWLWLLVGALYFPIVFVLTSMKKDGLLGGLSNRIKFELFGTSFLEWTGVLACFILIGKIMGNPIPTFDVAMLFVGAMVLGILSMIPGALGSFDVIIILGLGNLGLPEEKAVAWLLMFRLVYYFIPFLLGVAFGAKTFGGKFNENYRGVPLYLAKEVLNHVVTFLLYTSGTLMVLSATVPEAFKDLQWLKRLSPWSEKLVSEFPKILLGFLLILMGRAIANRIIRAYVPTLLIEFITLAYITFSGFSFTSEFFMLIVILLTIFTRDELFRKQLVFSYEMLFKDGFLFFGLIILYAGIGVYNTPTLHHRHHFNHFLLFPSERIWLTGFLAILLVNVIALVFIRYLQGEKKQLGEEVDEDRVYHVLNTYGGTSDSHLIFLNDKRMYMYQDKSGDDTVFLQFQTYHDKIICMGGPIGKTEDFENCLRQFVDEADEYGYAPIFYEVLEKDTLLLHELGFRFIKMGEEGKVALDTFTLSGKKQRGHRAIVNRLEREGYKLEVLDPTFSIEEMKRLKAISDEWLGERNEKGFSLGFFSESYLQKAPIAVVRDENEVIVAFASIMPSYTEDVVTVDLMRFGEEAPSGVMDYLFIKLFEHYREQGIHYFDLGMAPLSNVGVSRKSFIQERLANLVYQFGSKFYSFHGLRSYKEKYATSWTSRYTLYPRDNSILFVIYSLMIVDNRSADLGRKAQ